MSKVLNSQNQLAAGAEWLACQHVNLSLGLRSAFDGLRLYDYWINEPTLPEYCDQDEEEPDIDLSVHRINALGYDPLNSTFTHNAPIGASAVMSTLVEAEVLLDSVAFVSVEGDTDDILLKIKSIKGEI